MHSTSKWQLQAIAALQDNYIWLLLADQQAVIVDPGEAKPVLDFLQQHQLQPAAILLTHHHADHTGGVTQLSQVFPELRIYGPSDLADQWPNYQPLQDQDCLQLLGHKFTVIATPGHTLDHLCYYAEPYLFSGDTLFSAGCGRNFEGSLAQLFDSIKKLANLPNQTLMCCAHEYTLSNLRFAYTILTQDCAIKARLEQAEQLVAQGLATIPTTLEQEKRYNLFLRCHEQELQHRLQVNTALAAFSELRRQKNCF